MKGLKKRMKRMKRMKMAARCAAPADVEGEA
jgi:hypothetical protein